MSVALKRLVYLDGYNIIGFLGLKAAVDRGEMTLEEARQKLVEIVFCTTELFEESEVIIVFDSEFLRVTGSESEPIVPPKKELGTMGSKLIEAFEEGFLEDFGLRIDRYVTPPEDGSHVVILYKSGQVQRADGLARESVKLVFSFNADSRIRSLIKESSLSVMSVLVVSGDKRFTEKLDFAHTGREVEVCEPVEFFGQEDYEQAKESVKN